MTTPEPRPDHGKVALITGGGTGIGRSSALALASRGMRVAVNYSRSHDDAEATAADCTAAGGEGWAIKADVADPAEIDRLVAETVAHWGRIDVLVNNAGTTVFVTDYADLDALTNEVWDRILGLNVKSAFFAARAVAPHLSAVGGGAIVNVASISALRPVGSNLAYNASKAAMVSLTQSLAVALGPSGIRVNAVAPGHIETRWHAGRDAAAAASRERTPLGRNGSPDDVGGAVEYLATAPWITGEVIVVDGGRFLR